MQDPTNLLQPGRAVYVAVCGEVYRVGPAKYDKRQDFIERADTYGVTIRTRQAARADLPNEFIAFYPWPNVLRIEPDERKMIWAATWDEVPA